MSIFVDQTLVEKRILWLTNVWWLEKKWPANYTTFVFYVGLHEMNLQILDVEINK